MVNQHLPWPLHLDAYRAGYHHSLAVRQMEVSLTQVFNRPVQGRQFFEQVLRDNLDLGRPDRVKLLFPTRHTRQTPAPAHGYRTRIITQGVQPSLHVEYKRSHVKQYFKEGRALRTETTINSPADFKLNKGLEKNMVPLKKAADRVNHKLLEVQRVSDDCTLDDEAFGRLQRPTVEQAQRAPGLRFGDQRVMALLQTLCLFLAAPAGFRNRDFRPLVAAFLGIALDQYTRGRATYDLRRLRLKGLVRRQPGSHSYVVTPLGLRVAYFCTRLQLRVLRPAAAAIASLPDPVPRPLRAAFRRVDHEIQRLHARSGLGSAA